MPNRRQFLCRAATAAATATVLGRAWRRALADEPWQANEVIRESRQQALAVLQPSERDLQHGLELHRQSLVFDAYGFAPRAAIDGARLQALVEAGGSDAEIERLRADMMMTRAASDAVEREEFFQAWEAAGVSALFQNAGEEGNDPLRLLERLSRFTWLTDMLKPRLSKAATPDEIELAWRAGQRTLYLTTNGVPLAHQYDSVEDELRFVRMFQQLGVRMMHTTYNRRNLIGDGCAEPADAGLSDFGRAAVAEMNRQGVIVDVAHSGWRTSLEAAQASQRPMVASHSSCAAIMHHIRAKPVDVIRAICDTGGFIGICCIPRYLGGQGDIEALLAHIHYVVERFGPEHVAIGTDVAYASRQNAVESKKVNLRGRRRRAGYEKLWPEAEPFPSSPRQRSIDWVNWPMFTVGMVQRGYSDDTIQQILGGNVMRVCRANA